MVDSTGSEGNWKDDTEDQDEHLSVVQTRWTTQGINHAI